MKNTPVDTNLKYKEFEIFISVAEQPNRTWRADVLVYLGNKQIGNFKITEAFATKAVSEQAAFEAGKECAEKWRKKFEQAQDAGGAVILVWGVLYRFPDRGQADAALQWMAAVNATHEDFEFRFGQFQIAFPRPEAGNGWVI